MKFGAKIGIVNPRIYSQLNDASLRDMRKDGTIFSREYGNEDIK